MLNHVCPQASILRIDDFLMPTFWFVSRFFHSRYKNDALRINKVGVKLVVVVGGISGLSVSLTLQDIECRQYGHLSLSLSLSKEYRIFGKFFWRINPGESTLGSKHAIWIIPIKDLANHVVVGYTDKCSWCITRSFLTPDSLLHQVGLTSSKVVQVKAYESAVPTRFIVQ
jgi:hypothetical protein